MHSKIDDKAMEELRKLSQKEKSVKQKKRYDVVIAHYEGYKHEIISELLHVSRRSITQYVSDYKKGGIDALLIKKQSGRPKYLTEDQEKELYNIIATMTPEGDNNNADTRRSRCGYICKLDSTFSLLSCKAKIWYNF